MNEQIRNIEKATPAFYLEQVTPDLMASSWSMLEPHLSSVFMRSGGRLDAPSLARAVAEQRMYLLAVSDGEDVKGVVGIDIGPAESGIIVATIRFCSGDQAAHWLHLLSEIEDWARSNGASKIEAIARKGWAKRLPDYKLTHIVLEKDL